MASCNLILVRPQKPPNTMKSHVHALVLLSGALFASSTFAVDKLEGAFGLKLADVFEPAKAIGKSALTDSTPMYQFKPDKPFRSFSKYYVLITPTTHKIYSIWGIGRVENTESGKKEQALLMQLLTEKYGSEDKPGLMDAFSDSKHISQGQRYILTKITGFTDTTIEIRYYDMD